ncbi:MAG: long-chain fatty acid--CoA ligase [Nocardioidaceae bacterium]|nr:long-chain fatty acid--CoA ligase [Nocardioidaceae bacterium]
MREFSVPTVAAAPDHGSLTDDVLAQVAQDATRVLLRRGAPGAVPGSSAGRWSDVTAGDFRDQVVAFAKGLLAVGVQPEDRVAVLSRTRYEWTLADYAIWWVGAVTVPIYESSTTDQIAWILADSGSVAVVVEHLGHEARVAPARVALPALEHVWSIDEGAVAELSALGAEVSDDRLEDRRAAVTPGRLATIVYTSGTTGRPKGCPLTHGHFMAALDAASDTLDELFDRDAASTLLVLPLAHVFARVVQVACMRTGTTLGHTAEIAQLTAEIRSFRPTFVLAVPRVLETMYTSASQQAAISGHSRLFATAASTAIAWSQAHDSGRPGPALRARHAVLDRLVYRRLRARLGGRLGYALCGGGPLSERLAHFFHGIGLTVLEGYGLSETTAAVTANLPGLHKVGTVGRPLPGITVRVADDGELLFRGTQVFGGYWGNARATAAALAGGWFHTGDLGEIDGEGFVTVTGRKTEILVTAGGKSVAPAGLEDRIRAHPLVSQCLVVGDGRPYVAALVSLDVEATATWARTFGRSPDIHQLADDPDLRDEIATAVDAANTTVSRAESVRRFRVLTSVWTEQSGHLTPSQKLRRASVLQDYQADVDALYQ